MLPQFVLLLRHNFRFGRMFCSQAGRCSGDLPRLNAA